MPYILALLLAVVMNISKGTLLKPTKLLYNHFTKREFNAADSTETTTATTAAASVPYSFRCTKHNTYIYKNMIG